ncbi:MULTISPECIES: hypothetical protein [Solibacillus]|uniref:hypothetical protein n=1 Tax=Solibacillus TaxID=648800 RepID=UPI0007FB294E|nr:MULTISPECIES: hypothetical protein [Solibacillus]OBW54739.1 hypothetical protein A9986_14045 [Solibacillus silvestris]
MILQNENTMTLFEQYEYTSNVIKQLQLENHIGEMEWIQMESFDQIQDAFTDVLATFNGLTSANIPLIHESRKQSLKDYVNISNKLHAFVLEQARHELQMSSKDVNYLFKEVEFAGARYFTKDNPQRLF